MGNTDGHIYWLGKDGKVYFEKEDAEKYGGGVTAKHEHSPQKKWEPVQYTTVTDEKAPTLVPTVQTPITTNGDSGQTNLMKPQITNVNKELWQMLP